MKVSKNFILQEFIDPLFYDEYSEKAIWFIDARIIQSAQALRDNLGIPLTINNWYYGGQRKESGLRLPYSQNYSQFSQHSFGRAVDIVSDQMSAQEMRNHLYQNKHLYPHINAIEDKVSWLHIDCRTTISDNYLIFSPK